MEKLQYVKKVQAELVQKNVLLDVLQLPKLVVEAAHLLLEVALDVENASHSARLPVQVVMVDVLNLVKQDVLNLVKQDVLSLTSLANTVVLTEAVQLLFNNKMVVIIHHPQ